MSTGRQNQNRTAIVYFGPTPQDYLNLVESGQKHRAYTEYIQQPLAAQLTPDKHKPDCPDTSRYTVHSQIERQLRGSQTLSSVTLFGSKCHVMAHPSFW